MDRVLIELKDQARNPQLCGGVELQLRIGELGLLPYLGAITAGVNPHIHLAMRQFIDAYLGRGLVNGGEAPHANREMSRIVNGLLALVDIGVAGLGVAPQLRGMGKKHSPWPRPELRH